MGKKNEYGVHGPEQETTDLTGLTHSEPLSELELEMLRMLSDGLNPSQIGEELNYSETVVCAFLDSVVLKLNANSQVHAVATAIRLELIK